MQEEKKTIQQSEIVKDGLLENRGKNLLSNYETLEPFSDIANFGLDYKERRRNNKSRKQTAIIPREAARQQTKARPLANQRDLFGYLPKAAQKNAIMLSNGDNLLTQLVEGIDGDGIIPKVIIALFLELNEQSEAYETTETLEGATQRLLPFFRDGEEQVEAAILPTISEPIWNKETKKIEGHNPVKSVCPIIYINMAEFTKRVQGITTSPGGRDRDAVRNAIEELRTKKVYMPRGDGKYIFTTLIGKERGYIDTASNAEIHLIELDSIFTRLINKDKIYIRKDTLQILRGKQTRMTMRLLYFLLEQYSYKKATFPLDRISKRELFERIAIIKKYDRHPKDREADFQTALQKMVETHLLEPIKKKGQGYDKEGGYFEETGANGEIFCNFRFNVNYANEDAKKE